MSDSAAVRALKKLNEYIDNSTYVEGARMPPERVLADEIGVSRRALREALGQLEVQGKVWRGVGRGTFLGPQPLDSSGGCRNIPDIVTPPELMEARLVLESSVAAMASTRASTEELEDIRRCFLKSASACGVSAWEQWDQAFHMSIARAAHNKLISILLATVHSARSQADWANLRRASLTPEQQRLYTEQHRVVLSAIIERDAESAAEAMKTHLRTVKRALFPEY